MGLTKEERMARAAAKEAEQVKLAKENYPGIMREVMRIISLYNLKHKISLDEQLQPTVSMLTDDVRANGIYVPYERMKWFSDGVNADSTYERMAYWRDALQTLDHQRTAVEREKKLANDTWNALSYEQQQALLSFPPSELREMWESSSISGH